MLSEARLAAAGLPEEDDDAASGIGHIAAHSVEDRLSAPYATIMAKYIIAFHCLTR